MKQALYQLLPRGHQWISPHYLQISIKHPLEALGMFNQVLATPNRFDGHLCDQEYLQSEGFVIQVVCVGGETCGTISGEPMVCLFII